MNFFIIHYVILFNEQLKIYFEIYTPVILSGYTRIAIFHYNKQTKMTNSELFLPLVWETLGSMLRDDIRIYLLFCNP